MTHIRDVENTKVYICDMQQLLVLHGALGSKEQFTSLEKALSDEFKVYTLDFSGHGNRLSHHHAFTMQNFAHEVLKINDLLCGKHFIYLRIGIGGSAFYDL